jgi:hypothetical protein
VPVLKEFTGHDEQTGESIFTEILAESDNMSALKPMNRTTYKSNMSLYQEKRAQRWRNSHQPVLPQVRLIEDSVRLPLSPEIPEVLSEDEAEDKPVKKPTATFSTAEDEEILVLN